MTECTGEVFEVLEIETNTPRKEVHLAMMWPTSPRWGRWLLPSALWDTQHRRSTMTQPCVLYPGLAWSTLAQMKNLTLYHYFNHLSSFGGGICKVTQKLSVDGRGSAYHFEITKIIVFPLYNRALSDFLKKQLFLQLHVAPDVLSVRFGQRKSLRLQAQVVSRRPRLPPPSLPYYLHRTIH